MSPLRTINIPLYIISYRITVQAAMPIYHRYSAHHLRCRWSRASRRRRLKERSEALFRIVHVSDGLGKGWRCFWYRRQRARLAAGPRFTNCSYDSRLSYHPSAADCRTESRIYVYREIESLDELSSKIARSHVLAELFAYFSFRLS